MNYALIFAGGTGQRMNSKTKPKQFLELHGKPIIIYTLEQFDNHREIDAIVVVCLEAWIPYLEQLLIKFGITKVKAIVPGGASGQESIYHGIEKLHEFYDDNSVVLIHDGVRPLIDAETIHKNIESVHTYGSAITVAPAIETIAIRGENGNIGDIIERTRCELARAPQSFLLGKLYQAHQQALADGEINFIDSACLMRHYGHTLHSVEGPAENIKITTPSDFYVFRAIIDARENSQIFGL